MSAKQEPKKKIFPFTREGYFDETEKKPQTIASRVVKNLGGIGTGLFEGFLKTPRTPTLGEFGGGERFDFRNFEREIKETRPRKCEVLFSYQEKYQEATLRNEIRQAVSTVQREVVKLEKDQKALITDIEKVTVESLPNKPGVYHLRFFQWLISIVKSLRQKVNESRTWLVAMKSKKSQQNYWKMYKKHGTSFGLSDERVIATQAG